MNAFNHHQHRQHLRKRWFSKNVYCTKNAMTLYYPCAMIGLKALDDHGGGSTTTIADGSTTLLALLQQVGEGDEDAGTRGTDGVTETDSTSSNVDLLGVQAQELVVGKGNDREGLVELEKINVLNLQVSLLEGLGEGSSGSNGEINRSNRGIGKGQDAGEGLQAELVGLGAGHEDKGRGTIVQGRGVGGSDSAVCLLEDGLQAGDLVKLDILVLLILGKGLVAPLVLDGDGDDLVGKDTVLPSLGSASVRLDSMGILLLTGNLELVGGVLSAVTHAIKKKFT